MDGQKCDMCMNYNGSLWCKLHERTTQWFSSACKDFKLNTSKQLEYEAVCIRDQIEQEQRRFEQSVRCLNERQVYSTPIDEAFLDIILK